jgi:hypothetical protein
MTKNSDEMAFEEWVVSEDTHEKDGREGYFANKNNFTRDYWIAEKAWQEALKYKQEEFQRMENAWREKFRYETVRLSKEIEDERKRSEKLYKIVKIQVYLFNCGEMIDAERLEQALQEYQAREE